MSTRHGSKPSRHPLFDMGSLQRRRALVVLVGVSIAATIAWGATLGDDFDLTALSIAVAVAFGLVSSIQTAKQQVRAHTVDLMSNFQTADVLAEADASVARMMTTTEQISGSISEDDDRHLITLLDYYEFIAGASLGGLIDADICWQLRGGAMCNLYDRCGPYLADRRSVFGPGLYDAFETLVTQRRT